MCCYLSNSNQILLLICHWCVFDSSRSSQRHHFYLLAFIAYKYHQKFIDFSYRSLYNNCPCVGRVRTQNRSARTKFIGRMTTKRHFTSMDHKTISILIKYEQQRKLCDENNRPGIYVSRMFLAILCSPLSYTSTLWIPHVLHIQNVGILRWQHWHGKWICIPSQREYLPGTQFRGLLYAPTHTQTHTTNNKKIEALAFIHITLTVNTLIRLCNSFSFSLFFSCPFVLWLVIVSK